MTIVFPDYPTKVQMTEGRRKKYFEEGEKIPKKYQDDHFTFRHRPSRKDFPKCLYNSEIREFVVKNEKFVDVPRYQSLSYNKISTRLKVPVLIKLKEWMSDYIPRSLGIYGSPITVKAFVYDWPIPLNKDLDNMHIYYKAFLDLLTQRGLIKGDSKLHISQSGGFRFIPINNALDRKLVFELELDLDPKISRHVMYNLTQKEVIRGGRKGYELVQSQASIAGELAVIHATRRALMNFGKTKIIRPNADKLFRQVFDMCVNHNTSCWVSEEFYRVHVDRIQRFLLNAGIQVYINV